MPVLANRARVSTSTTGTGTITLGSPNGGFQSFADAGITNGVVVRYVIEDINNNWEIGTGTYSSTGPTLTRTPSESSNAGAAINLSGNAVVFVSAGKEELQRAADMDQGVATTDNPTFAGANLTANLSLGDAVSADFGSGASLSITSVSGVSSVIVDTTPNLIVASDALVVNSATLGQTMITAAETGPVQLYYNNNLALSTAIGGTVEIPNGLTSNYGTFSTGLLVPAAGAASFGDASEMLVGFNGTEGIVATFTPNDIVIQTDFTERLRFSGTGNITAAANFFLNADPTSNLQAATKQYVDTIAAAGLHYHSPVRVEEPNPLTVTYNNGTAGVGATLTNAGAQAALVLDGVTLSLNDRVLIYQQTDAAQNGIYTVTDVGSGSTNWVLTRATDADSYGPSDPDSLGQGDAFFVLEGDTGAGELYVMNTEGTITFGTTAINFVQVASTAVYSAGTGLNLTGTVFSTVQDISVSSSPTFAGLTATTADINGGTIDNTIIGGSTPAAISGTTGSFSGDVSIADKIVHTGDTNTAIRFPAADTVTVETNGAERMRVDASGNVGVGQTPPAGVPFSVASGGFELFRINTAGRVGIFTSSPATTLDVNGTVTATAFSGNGANVTNVDAATLGGDSKATILATAEATALALAIALG